MNKYYKKRLLIGNCLDTLKTLADSSIDSIVTDPPYELGFMNKSWDNSGVAYQVSLWQECLRVLKPGGHLLAFGGTRTYHRMAVAIEDAGFEIRDSIHWTYGSGFPKSLDISKAIDKAAKAERKVVGTNPNVVRASKVEGGSDFGGFTKADATITAPATEAAKQWQGWGTALKPSHEPIVLARKKLIGTVAENVLQYKTGGINIDGSRIGTDPVPINIIEEWSGFGQKIKPKYKQIINTAGRFPANTLLTHNHNCQDTCTPNCPVAKLNQQTEDVSRFFHNSKWQQADDITPFIYQAKAGKKERNAGLNGLPEKRPDERTKTGMGTFEVKGVAKQSNFHPTVKPIEVIKYLIKLITPSKGIVLDPFLGSGTTAVAAIELGYDWVGCEITEDYIPIITGRINYAKKNLTNKKEKRKKKNEI